MSSPETPQEQIHNSVLELIGNTPMVRLQRVPKEYGIECEVLVKLEYQNPAGSVKDRIGKEMILAAEREGSIQKGGNLIEATSGNTGIGMSLVAAAKGYGMIITLPEKMSNEKVSVLKALGAKIYRTPTELRTFEEGSHYMVAKGFVERGEAVGLDQYYNPHNPLVSYFGVIFCLFVVG